MKLTQNIILSFIIICLMSVSSAYSNNNPKEKTIIVSGKIVDLNKNELLAGVSITASQVEKTIYSDLNGNFFIYIKVKDASNFKLEFSQVGYSSKILSYEDLSKTSGNLEITLTEE